MSTETEGIARLRAVGPELVEFIRCHMYEEDQPLLDAVLAALSGASSEREPLRVRVAQLEEALRVMLGESTQKPWTIHEVLACGCDPHVEHCEQCDQRRRENEAMEPKNVARSALSGVPSEWLREQTEAAKSEGFMDGRAEAWGQADSIVRGLRPCEPGQILFEALAERDARIAAAAREEGRRTGRLEALEQYQSVESPTWPWVVAFAKLMEAKLAKNRHKGNREGWIGDAASALLKRLYQEADELQRAFATGAVAEIPGEAADVANFAMMIADVVGGLDGTLGGGGVAPTCTKCHQPLQRGPIGGGHFDWLECDCAERTPKRGT